MTMVALLADIHANAPALDAVLSACAAHEVTTLWCAGDVVGYNAFASETIDMAQRAGMLAVHGNHDLMVTGRLEARAAGPRALRAVTWTRARLTAPERAWLDALPGALRVADGVICVHATLGDTERRIESDVDFRREAAALLDSDPGLRVCVCGHTHRAAAVRVTPGGRVERHRATRVELDEPGLWFVNPGSVGEPRDSDWRASFALLDWPARRVHFQRAPYKRSSVSRVNALRLPPLAASTEATPHGAGAWLRAVVRRFAPASA